MSDAYTKLALNKNRLFRNNYRRLVFMLVFLTLVLIGQTGFLGYLLLNQPDGKNYATTTTGVIVPLQSLSEPVVTQDYMLQWAGLAVRSAFNLTFTQYKSQLNHAKIYFTSSGWSEFMDAMNSAGVIDSLKQNKLFMSAIVSGAPVVLDRYINHGVYTWRLQIPLLVTYNSASEQRKRHFMVSMTVIRVPVLNLEQGIAINDISVR